MHSPVTQDTVVSQGEITSAESRGRGGGSSSKAGNKTEAREVETSLTTREDGEIAVAGGNSSFYLFLSGIYTGRSSPG